MPAFALQGAASLRGAAVAGTVANGLPAGRG